MLRPRLWLIRHRFRLEYPIGHDSRRRPRCPGDSSTCPFRLPGTGSRRLVATVWEQRLLDRFKAYLTFADGRMGVRPLANTLQGGGARIFYNDLVGGVDAEVTSTLGASSHKRQHHILALEMPAGLTARAWYASEPNESFHGFGQTARNVERTVFRQTDIHLQLSYSRRSRNPINFSWVADYHSRDVGPGESRCILRQSTGILRLPFPDSTIGPISSKPACR